MTAGDLPDLTDTPFCEPDFFEPFDFCEPASSGTRTDCGFGVGVSFFPNPNFSLNLLPNIYVKLLGTGVGVVVG